MASNLHGMLPHVKTVALVTRFFRGDLRVQANTPSAIEGKVWEKNFPKRFTPDTPELERGQPSPRVSSVRAPSNGSWIGIAAGRSRNRVNQFLAEVAQCQAQLVSKLAVISRMPDGWP